MQRNTAKTVNKAIQSNTANAAIKTNTANIYMTEIGLKMTWYDNDDGSNWMAVWQSGTKVANPIDKDDIINDAEQIQLTNMRASAVDIGEELHCTGEYICQLDLQGIADYRSLSIRFATLDNLRCWQDNHLHTIELYVQVKYKGKVQRLCG